MKQNNQKRRQRRGVLLVAFEPFGGHEINSSWEAVRGFDDEVGEGAQLNAYCLPVRYESASEELRGAVERLAPDIVLGFGMAESARTIRIETTARNADTSQSPDNDGVLPSERVILRGGPAALRADFEPEMMAAALRGEGFPTELSDDAGGYLCNHVFYHIMTLSRRDVVEGGGFYHLPPLGEAWPRRRLEAAVERLIERALLTSESHHGSVG